MGTETHGTFGIWDYAVFILVLAISASIGLFHGCGGKQRTTNEFLMGNREMQILPVSLSMLASFMSAITVLGVPAEIYRFGTQFMMISVAYGTLMPVIAFLYIPVFYNLNLTSMYEYLEIRFRKSGLKLIGSVTFIVQMTLYMAIALYAPCLALNAVTGLNVWVSVFSVGIVCTFYTTLGGMKAVMWTAVFQVVMMITGILTVLIKGCLDKGGMKAVMWTDVFQVVMMVTGILTVLIKGCLDMGGIANVWSIAQEGGRIEFFNFDPDPRTRNTVWTTVVGGFFQWLVIYAGSQAQVQRCLACPTLKNAQIALILNGPGLIILNVLTGLCGLVCYAYYRYCDPLNNGDIAASDQILPLFVMEAINIPGVPGLFVACVLSAALSSISSGLNSLSAVTMQDFVLKKYPDLRQRPATILAKLLALSYGILMMICAVLASQLGAVLQAAFSLFGMTGGPLVGLFCLGLYFPQANWKGGVIGWAASLAYQFWLVFGANIVKPYIPQLPRSTEQCDVFNGTLYDTLYENTTNSYTLSPLPLVDNITVSIETPEEEKVLFYEMYSISFLWYPMIGVLLTVIIGLPASYLTGGEDLEQINPKTIMPLCDKICCCLPQSVRQYFWCDVDHDMNKDSFIYKNHYSADYILESNPYKETGEPLMTDMKMRHLT